jgi:adenosylhomocysteine nucleosidase
MILIGCAFKAELAALRSHLFGNNAASAERLNSGLAGYEWRSGSRHIAVVMTGIGLRKARSATRQALQRWPAPEFILSTGVAGGLHSSLAIGTIVLPNSVMTCHAETGLPEHVLEVTHERRESLRLGLERSGKAAVGGTMFSSRKPLSTIADKMRAAELCGAVAVDMESAAIALEAAARGIPYVCLRTILDRSSENIVGAELAGENGNVRPLAALGAIARNPSMVVGGIRLLRNLRFATRAMGEAVAAALSEVN